MNMAGKRFAEAANRKVESGYDRPDRIPETDKTPWVYSQESTLEKITGRKLRNTGGLCFCH